MDASLLELTPLAPRPAPLDMPRQVLERPARPSLLDVFARMFLRNA